MRVMNVHNAHVSVYVMFAHCSFVWVFFSVFFFTYFQRLSWCSVYVCKCVYVSSVALFVQTNVFRLFLFSSQLLKKGSGFPRIYNIIYWSWYYSDVSFDRHHLCHCCNASSRAFVLILCTAIVCASRGKLFLFILKYKNRNVTSKERKCNTKLNRKKTSAPFPVVLHFIIWSMHVFLLVFSNRNHIHAHTWKKRERS